MTHEAGQTPPIHDRARRRMQSQRATRRSVLMTLLGTVIPGAGLVGTRYRRLGWTVIAALGVAVFTVAAVVVLLGPTSAALAVAVRPTALLVVAILAGVSGLVWILTILLTHRATLHGSMDRSQRGGLRVLTAALCLVIAVPMGTAVGYSLIQRDIVGAVFVNGGSAGTDTPDAPSRPGPGPDPWAGIPRVNMLLLGSDAGDDRIGVRTDSMMVASIDPSTGETLLFSLPRNLENVPFPKSNPLSKQFPRGYNCGPPDCLLNGVWSLAEANEKLFVGVVNPGLTTTRGVIEEITGLRMHYTTVIDLKGFESLVDAMGGVVVTVTERLPVEGHLTSSGHLVGVREWLQPGTQRLDGYHALWFARSRATTDDYSRMRRQRCLVGKILGQVNPATMLAKYPALARVVKDNVTTDIAGEDLPAWVELVGRVQGASISSLAFTTDNISPGNPDFPKIRTMIQDALGFGRTSTPATSKPAKTTSPPSTSTSTSTATRTTEPSKTTAPVGAPVDLADAC